MKYNKPYGAAGADDPYINGDPSIGRAGSIPPAEAIEYPQREIANLITDTGVTPANTDLRQLGRAIQSGKLFYGVDTGSVNNFSAVLSPVPLAYVAGLTARILMSNAPSGASVLNLNSLGNLPITKGGNLSLVGGEWAIGDVVTFTCDGTHFQVAALPNGVQLRLTANKTIYVNGAIGNDANDGVSNTVGHALATPQAAVNLAFNYAPSQYAITIQIAAGSYGPAITPVYSGPNIVIVGASETTVLLDGGNTGPAVAVQGPNTMTVVNLRGQNNAPVGQSPIFLASAGGVMYNSGTGSNFTNNAVFQAFGGTFNPSSHTFRNSCSSLFLANIGGHIQFQQGAVFTFAASITVNQSAFAGDDGSIGVPTPSAPTFVNPGNVTGSRFAAVTNGVINSSGAGTTYFPGTVAGSTSTGGQYV